MNKLNDTAILITTFLRDGLLFRCIESVRKYYPAIDIYVGDNGDPSDAKTAFLDKHGCTHLMLPFDSGVGGTRNAALAKIPKDYKYIAIIEDDIVFTKQSSLEPLKAILESDDEIGIAGGLLIVDGGREQHYEAETWIDGQEHHIRKVTEPTWIEAAGMKFFLCDIILNVFLMRRDVWDEVKWDAQFKTAFEHSDFFLRLKYDVSDGRVHEKPRRWKVAYAPDVVFLHLKGEPNIEYNQYRRRPVGFTLFAKKWGVKLGYSSFQRINPISYEAQGMDYGERDEALEKAIHILTRHKCKWWLEAGTCLGAFRERDFIAHDMDMDIGLMGEHVDLWDTLQEEFLAAGFKLYKAWEHGKKKIELSFKLGASKLDLFFFYPHGDFLWHGAWGPNEKGQWGANAVFLLHVFPKQLFENLKEFYFRNKRCFIPSPTEEYLLCRYGPDWKTPNAKYQYWKDCQAIDPNFFKKVKTVFIGGVWDILHVGHLNILERCRALGTKLVVGVLTDEAAARYKPKPLMPFEDRRRIIDSLGVVDEAIGQNDQDPTEDLKRLKLKPHYIVHGDDWNAVPGLEYVKSNGGKAVFFPYTEGVSSSLIKEQIAVRNRATEPATADWKAEVKADAPEAEKTPEIAVCVKTFFREAVLYKSIDAIRKRMPYPYRLYIADDGPSGDKKEYFYQRLEKDGHKVCRMPYNSGISIGRNAIVRASTEPYVLITDDDIAPDSADTIRKMRVVLDSTPDIGVISAVLHYENGGFYGNRNYAKGLMFEQRGQLLLRIPSTGQVWKTRGDEEILFAYADQVPNFFLARREIFDSVRWDDRIKVEYEHVDFFLELKKTNWKAAVCLDAEATHFRSIAEDEYMMHRRKSSPAYLYQKHGLANIINQF